MPFWLGNVDSNHDCLIQSQVSCQLDDSPPFPPVRNASEETAPHYARHSSRDFGMSQGGDINFQKSEKSDYL